MGDAATKQDPLLKGFYTVSDAARLLGIENKHRIYVWIQGHANKSAPVIHRDFMPVDSVQELSFWDLMEVRFIEHFRKQKISLQLLRKIAAKARDDFKNEHPFALSKVIFMTDRKRIFTSVIEESGEQRIKDALGEQYEMYDIIEGILAKGLTFDPKTHLVGSWKPFPTEFPGVIIDPRFAYGHPVVGQRHVPTSALLRTWKAEGGDMPRVAEWFGLSRDDVEQAIQFESRLAA